LAEAAETFSMLASPIRLHLLWLLAQGGKDVGTLAEAVGTSVATVSQHLAKLRLSDLVSARREGKRQVYEVDDPHVVTLVRQALDHHADLQSRPRTRARRVRVRGLD
jgi:DNA-binding transcriptional ArsR family regulator